MSEAVNGGNNENKSESKSKSGALQKLLPVDESADALAERHQRRRPAWGGSVGFVM
jgi:hypothetical protein